MVSDWIVGEPHRGGVRFFACCAACGARLPVRDGRDARAALDWHALVRHSVVLRVAFAAA